MLYMNTFDIEQALATALRFDLPVMTEAVYRLIRLVNWTNANSDGWAYWKKPLNAARQLMELIQSVDPYADPFYDRPSDIDRAALKKACVPIKAFLTRQGVDHEVIFGERKPEMQLVTMPQAEDLMAHAGHPVAIVTYGNGVNVALECEQCSLVLMDYDGTLETVS